MTQFENYHIFEVKYLSPTTYKGARVSIKSHIFEQSIIISYDYAKGNILEIAADYLKQKGFNLIGCGELSKNYVLISDTFEPLK